MEQLEDLHKAIQNSFGDVIDEDVFIASITLFPAIIVAYTDGVIDEKEKEYIAFLADNYVFHSDDILEENKVIFSDILCSFLLAITDQISLWKTEYIEALKCLLNIDNSLKSELLIIIENIARISNEVSETEQEKIEWLKIELSI
jgi:tellurite resistance protein